MMMRFYVMHFMWHFPQLHIDQADFSSLPQCHRSPLDQRLQSWAAPVSQWVFRGAISGRHIQVWLVCTQPIHHRAEDAATTRNTAEQVLCAHCHLVWEVNQLCGGSWSLCEKILWVRSDESRSCGWRPSLCWRPVNDTIKHTPSPLLLFFQGDSSWSVLAIITSAN